MASMNEHPPGRSLLDSRFEIISLFLIEDWPLEKVKSELEQRQSASIPHLTLGQWKYRLPGLGIFKNLSETEVAQIKNVLGSETTSWSTLIFANNILLDNCEVDRHAKRKKIPSQVFQPRGRRSLTFIPLPFSLTVLGDLATFRSFRRLLFHTSIYFEISFNSGTWAPDGRGLYARSLNLRNDLCKLSELHNMVVDALDQFKKGRSERSWAITRQSFASHQLIVQSHHHRQFPDILAILLLLHRNKHGYILQAMTKSLLSWAEVVLPPNDPRKIMFECLSVLPMDAAGHLYLAFDSYCRHLWTTKIGHSQVKAYYSYNQASFPRADTGEFYDFYKGKTLPEIKYILDSVDRDLGEYSHETFCLWHTAIRCFRAEGKFREMANLVQSLCMRVHRLGSEFDYRQQRQLNVDCSLSLFLLGDARQLLGDLKNARVAFLHSAMLRDQLISIDKWDPSRTAALKRLEQLAISICDNSAAGYYRSLLDTTYSALEKKDKAEQARCGVIPVNSTQLREG